jgi:hypothetical protein
VDELTAERDRLRSGLDDLWASEDEAADDDGQSEEEAAAGGDDVGDAGSRDNPTPGVPPTARSASRFQQALRACGR